MLLRVSVSSIVYESLYFIVNNDMYFIFYHYNCITTGKVPVDVQYFFVDMLSLVGHKFGAPKGIAALYINPNIMYVLVH